MTDTIRCRECGYDGYDRYYESQGDGAYLCQGCWPRETEDPDA